MECMCAQGHRAHVSVVQHLEQRGCARERASTSGDPAGQVGKEGMWLGSQGVRVSRRETAGGTGC